MSIDSGPTPSPIDRTLRVPGADPGATAPVTHLEPTVAVGRANAADPAAVPLQPVLVDARYRIEGELGHGGMGVVYLARDVSLDRFVALKMIAPGWEGDPAMSARFKREAKALAAIRSPYVVQIHDFGEHQGQHFFAMEYVRGRTLREILVEHRRHDDRVPLHRALTLLSRIARGVGAVHTAGIVHRDVKPANVVIEEDTGRPVLVDFGLALPYVDTATTIRVGTPHYMAPEQAGYGAPGRSITQRADVYALGIMTFEMLAGRVPFDGTCAKLLHDHAHTPPPLLSATRPDLAPFDAVISRALAKDPDDRYPSCGAFADALAAAGHRWTASTLPTLPMPAIAPFPTRPSVAPRPERPFYILVVDDSPLFRDCTVRAAQIATQRRRWSRPVAVEGVESGEEALDRAAVQPPDLVLLDLDMPGLDGIDTLSRLRALPGGDAARVVVLSGRVRPSDRWRFAVLGVNDFLSKQVEFPALVDRIEAIAKRYDDSTRGRLL